MTPQESAAPDEGAGSCDGDKSTENNVPETETKELSIAPATKNPGGGKTITMIMEAAGKESVELQPPSVTNVTRGSRTVRKSLGNDEGIIADEDKYDVKDVLARGGMGMVMAAQDVNIRRQVAVKVMLPKAEQDPESLLRFVEEAQVTGQLEHPNIVPVHELGVQSTGQVFYTMKMIKGRTLKDILKKIRKGDKATIEEFHLTRLITIFMKICDAIAFAHDHKVIHRDLKPENIMIGEFGEVLVVDWGLAKILPKKTDDTITVDDIKLDEKIIETVRSAGSDAYVTMDGKVMGTPRYMAPEQVRGINASIDCRADIYSLGAILYRILTLHNHIDGKQVYEILKNCLIGEHVPIEKYENEANLPHCPGGKLPFGLKAVVDKCLKVKPNERYQSVQDLQQDIEAWQKGFATGAEGASLLRQIGLLIARNKAVFSVAGVAFLLLSTFGAIAVNEIVKERDAADLARVQAESARDIAEAERAKKEAALVKEEKAKQQALYERALAIEARENERKAKEMEQKARKEAELENYSNTLKLANARIKEGLFDQAKSLLWGLPKTYRHWEWGYLLNQCHPELMTVDVKSDVLIAVFSPDVSRIAVGAFGGTIKVLDTVSRKEIRSWKAHKYRVDSISFSPDGSKVLTSGNGNAAYVWDVGTGKKILSLNVEGKVSIKSGVFSSDGRKILTITAPHSMGSDGQNEHSPTPLFGSKMTVPRKFTFPGYEAFSRTGDQIVLQTTPTAIQLWDAESGKRLSSQDTNTPPAVSQNITELLPECRRIGILELDDRNSAVIWDFSSQKVLSILRGHTNTIWSLVFSPDGNQALTASEDNTTRLWDVKTGRQIAVYTGHGDAVYCSRFSPDGRLIISSGNDENIKIWKSGRGSNATGMYPENTIYGCAFSPDGQRIVFEGYKAMICDFKTGRKLADLEGDGNFTNSLMFSPDGSQIVGTCGGNSYIWDADTGVIQHTFKGDGGWINSIVFSPDGKQVVTAGRSGKVSFWNAMTGEYLRSFDAKELRVSSLSFSPNGNRLAWMGSVLVRKEENVEIGKLSYGIWDVVTGKKQVNFWGVTRRPRSIAFSPKGDYIVTGEHKVSGVLDAHTGETLFKLKGHASQVVNAIFSPDGKRIATASLDRTVRIWDFANEKELLTIRGFTGDPHNITFSPDGFTLMVANDKQPPRFMKAYDWGLDEKAIRALKLEEFSLYLNSTKQ